MAVRAALSALIVVMMVLAMAALVFVDIPTANRDLFNTALGVVSGALAGVVSYWLGSSQSSAGKDHTIRSLTKEGD